MNRIVLKLRSTYDKRCPEIVDAWVTGPPRQQWPWVAEITGNDEVYRYSRRFIDGQRDFSDANGDGSRGIVMYFWLQDDRLYQAHEPGYRRQFDRWFFRTEHGRIIKINQSEVDEWLAKNISA